MTMMMINSVIAKQILKVFIECLFPGINLKGEEKKEKVLRIKKIHKEKNRYKNSVHFRYEVFLDDSLMGYALMHFDLDGIEKPTIVYVPSIKPWNLMELVYEVSSLPYLIFTRKEIHTPEIEAEYSGTQYQIEELNELVTAFKGEEDD